MSFARGHTNPGHLCLLQYGYTEPAASCSKGIQGVIRIGIPRFWFISRFNEIFDDEIGPHLLNIITGQNLTLDPHTLLQCDVLAQSPHIALRDKRQKTGLDETAITTNLLIEILKDTQAVQRHSGGGLVRIMLADDGRGFSRRPDTDDTFLEHGDL